MRWILIALLMCNGIYFLWQNYLAQNEKPMAVSIPQSASKSGEGLVLLSEVAAQKEASAQAPVVAQERSVDRVVQAEVAPVAQDAPNICWQIGPFKEQVSGKQVVNRLAALDIALQLQSIEIPGKPDYWVHIPPQISRKAAIKLLRELQAKKIDSFLITEGELENGISLGFFTQEDRAQAIFKQRVKQGYGAEIKIVPRARTELWAVFDTGEYGKFSDVLWDKIKEGNKGLERRKNYCDKIAPKDNFD